MTIRKIVIWISKNCQWQLWKTCLNFWPFFDIQMSFLWRVRDRNTRLTLTIIPSKEQTLNLKCVENEYDQCYICQWKQGLLFVTIQQIYGLNDFNDSLVWNLPFWSEMFSLAPKWGRLPPNGENPVLFHNRFQYNFAREEIGCAKIMNLPHLGSI